MILLKIAFYILATIALFKIATEKITVVNTSVVGMVEACRFHNGIVEIYEHAVVCRYPKEIPTIKKIN